MIFQIGAGAVPGEDKLLSGLLKEKVRYDPYRVFRLIGETLGELADKEKAAQDRGDPRNLTVHNVATFVKEGFESRV